MAGNTYGTIFKLSTFGESHGKAIGGVIDGCPAGVELDLEAIQRDLDRRKPGQSAIVTQRKEPDEVEFFSGIFEGKTTGTPIGFAIHNTNQKSKDYSHIKDSYRPSHADYVYDEKYGIRDYRGGGRSSARETASRVVAGAIAKQFLNPLSINAYVSAVGNIKLEADPATVDFAEIENNPVRCPDQAKAAEMEAYIKQIRKEGDTIGGIVTCVIKNVPVGLGEPVFDRLDADLAHAMMGINAVKGVEIGDGFDVINQKGSEHRDKMTPDGFATNHAGGVLGGISTGQDVLVHMALKPTSSITVPGETITVDGELTDVITKGRHDPCVGIRAVPIAEAMAAIVIMDHLLRHRGQNAGVTSSTPVIAGAIPNA